MVLQLQLWQLPLLMCLAGLLLSDICRGEHLVHIQEGPLYRVKGYPMSISCNVSGYSGQADQGFAFSVYKPDYPQREIKMISTFDPNYAYKVYRQRVIEKSIEIKRLSKTSVILHLKLLQADDAGVFECFTPNIYDTYEGTYNGKTTVNVIEDTLKASFSGPASYSISEGESLQLECEVSSQTMQHTHLSVTWYLRGNTETLPIITLDRDLTVRPGAAFEKQYHSGLISIEKVEDTTYRLKMSQVQQSARGEVYCQAEEWIQDPDRSWIRIAYKITTGSNVEIKALEVVEVGSFIATIDVSETLQEGEKAVIRCSVQAQNLLGRFFSITWLRNNMEVAHIGPSGVLTVANDYKERENAGELRAVKISDNAYVLTIRPVRAEDHGQYRCKATQEERAETGVFTRGQSELSSEKTVHIKAKESGLTVIMAEKSINVIEGETLKLTCSVSKASGPLSVSWQHRKSTTSPFKDVISLNHEGVMVRGTGAQYQDRIVRTFRSTATDFTLEISGAVPSDSGEYKCTVSEWNMDRSGSINSQTASVFVESIDSSLKVSLRSRDTNVTENSLITMICTVKGPKVPLDVHWKFKFGSDVKKDIICMLRNGAISCGREQKDYQLEVQVQDTMTVFYLRILKASRKQQGSYQCQITAYQESVQKAQKFSNDLAVSVHAPVSKLSLSISPKAHLDIPIKSNAKIDCLVDKAVSNSSRFAVTWMFDAQTLVKMDSEGVVTLGPAASKEINQRINMQMIERRTFQLAIQEVRSTDRGQYKCLVEEWIQDPDGIWYPLLPKYVTMNLVVNEQASDFSLNKSDTQLVVTEGQQVDLSCSLHTGGLDSTFRYSLIWFFERQDQKASMVPLLTYSHDGRLQFSSDDPKLQHRLYFSRPTISDFRLSILNSISSDTGRYLCQVDQYQLDCKGKWEFKAGNKSGFTNVNVRLIENKLQVKKVSRSLNVTDHRAGFTVECEISSRSSDKSHFEVTWTKSQEDGQLMTIFTAKRDGTLSDAISDRNLLYSRPRATLYRLTLPDVEPSDNGRYQCQVVEWLQTDTWREVAKDKSGELFVHVESEKKPSTGTFVLEKPNSHLSLIEGEQFVLNCSILVDKADPTFHYNVTWLLVKQETRTNLLEHSKDGRLQYQSEKQQLNSRLQFSRSTVTNFHLTVFNSLPADSGTYQCLVEQHQLGCGGTWESKGRAQMISTNVTVRSIESKLQVMKESRSLNLTAHHDRLTIECHIISRSSDKSVFEVTWHKSQEKEPPMTFFKVTQDGTLQSDFTDRNLVYEHPSANVYILTVPDVDFPDNGRYQCQVVEWLQSATNTWRKVAEDKSGEHSVHVHVEAAPSESKQDCSSGMILGILTPLLFILLVVIVLLLLMVQKTKSASKKQKDSLWAENNPLKPVPEPTAGEGDSA